MIVKAAILVFCILLVVWYSCKDSFAKVGERIANFFNWLKDDNKE